jgi:hypothetical protein
VIAQRESTEGKSSDSTPNALNFISIFRIEYGSLLLASLIEELAHPKNIILTKSIG